MGSSKSLHTLQRLVRLIRDRRGVSAIEFAIIAPVMILIYLGAVELGSALTVYRRTSQVAVAAADLTAQVPSVTKADIHDIQAAAASILTPYSTTPLKVVLSSVVADNNNRARVEWSCATSGAARGAGSSFNVPAGLTEPNTSIIVAEVNYEYSGVTGLGSLLDDSTINMTRTFYTRPRTSLKVTKTDNGC